MLEIMEEFLSIGNFFVKISFGGYSRSPTIIIAYLMKKNNMGFEDAFNYVKEIKQDIHPNDGFIEKLKYFEKRLFTEIQYIYKCGKCRKTLFNDKNVDFEHFYSPKDKYSYKRYNKVIIILISHLLLLMNVLHISLIHLFLLMKLALIVG